MEWRRSTSMTLSWQSVVVAVTVGILMQISYTDGLNAMEKCTNSTECPSNSACSPRGCEGSVCLCEEGFVPAVDLTGCYRAALLSRPCDGVTVRCSETLALCKDGRCECLPAHVPAGDNLRCKIKPAFGLQFALLGEFCDGTTVICQGSDQQFCDLTQSQCVCKAGLRPATPEELLAEPFRIHDCRPDNFSLSLPPDELDCVEPVLPVSANIGETCVSYNNCPAFADCLPRGCDSNVCVCIEGFYPTNSGMECKAVVYLNERCDTDTICHGENQTTACINGMCSCGPGFIRTSDDRCKPAPEPKLEYALFSEVCGHLGDKRILCYDEWTMCDSVMDGRCVCQYGTRPATNEEKARDWANPSPCRLQEYGLDTPTPEMCERRKALESCQNWGREEIVWREFFKRRLTSGEQGSIAGQNDWMTEWTRHRDKLRDCSELMPPTEDDNWSEEIREVRIN